MTKAEFLARRAPVWKRFEALLEVSRGKSRNRLEGGEVAEFSELLRSTSHDLAKVRSHDWGQELETYLNELVVRGHNRFYHPPPGRLRSAASFLATGFPRLVRANAAYVWVGLTLLFVPGIVSAIALASDPALATRVIPSAQLDLFDEMYSESAGPTSFSRDDAAMAGFYVWHNGSIAFQCFAMGMLLGLGTVFILVYNGVILGGVAGYVVAQGHSDRFFGFVVGHGSFELIAIAVAGAAGLVLGHSIIRPGRYSRTDSLRLRGSVAVQLAAGAGAMIVVAAMIEGFWSAQSMPNVVRYTVGAISWILVIAYLVLVGRGKEGR